MESLLPTYLRAQYHRLLSGREIRLGPVSLVSTHHLAGLRNQRYIPTEADRRRSAGSGGSRRSVVFLHNSYYHFFYLAKALRDRDWDAVSVSLEDPSGSNAFLYHGEDANLYDSDPDKFYGNIASFYATAPERFRMVFFYGSGWMSFFPINYDCNNEFDACLSP